MKNEILDVQYLPYLSSDFDKWKNGDYTFIPDNVTNLDRVRVQEKAIIRNNRYFGECIVLREFSDQFIKSRYSHSYKWLYADSWCSNRLKDQLQNEFYLDLFDYFPENKIRKAQSKAKKYIKKNRIKPSSPDVWLIAEYPNSWFIEVKKLNEERRKGQLEGLAIIAKYLKCKVSIYRLYSETEEPKSRLVESDKKEFQEIYQSLNNFL
jgi:hypothetical protein